MSKEHLEILEASNIVFSFFWKTGVIIALICIYDSIREQNKWLMDEDEIDNIGKK